LRFSFDEAQRCKGKIGAGKGGDGKKGGSEMESGTFWDIFTAIITRQGINRDKRDTVKRDKPRKRGHKQGHSRHL